MEMSGKLCIVSTPIGNLDDITLRALQTLKDADVIIAEDTRSASMLLRHFGIPHKKIISFFEGNEEKRLPEILNLLQTDIKAVLISESGTPLVSDPGFKLIRDATRVGIQVEAIPGPTALINALVLSGLPTNAFIFLGFLPKKEIRAKKLLERTKTALFELDEVKTVIIYESQHRLLKTFASILDVFGNIQIAVAREMTKIHEEVRREKVSETIAHFAQTPPKGEFTIVFSKV